MVQNEKELRVGKTDSQKTALIKGLFKSLFTCVICISSAICEEFLFFFFRALMDFDNVRRPGYRIGCTRFKNSA